MKSRIFFCDSFFLNDTCFFFRLFLPSVITTPEHNCRASPHSLTLDHNQGYLSSYVTSTSLCGSTPSPWVVQGKTGQHVNLTLYDFSTVQTEQQNTGTITCENYATVSGKTSTDWSFHFRLFQRVHFLDALMRFLPLCICLLVCCSFGWNSIMSQFTTLQSLLTQAIRQFNHQTNH